MAAVTSESSCITVRVVLPTARRTNVELMVTQRFFVCNLFLFVWLSVFSRCAHSFACLLLHLTYGLLRYAGTKGIAFDWLACVARCTKRLRLNGFCMEIAFNEDGWWAHKKRG